MSHTPDKSKLPKALQGLEWEKYSEGTMFWDGDNVLVAIPICNDSAVPDAGWVYELTVLRIKCDEHYFATECVGCQEGSAWDIDAIDFYVRL